MPFLPPNQQHQSTESSLLVDSIFLKKDWLSLTHNDSIYHASIVSHNKNTPNLNFADTFSKKSSIMSYNPSATKVICEQLRSHPSYKEQSSTDLPASCATSCTISTADKSNHSAVGTLHPQCSAICFLYVTLRCLIPSPKNLPLPVEDYPPSLDKNHAPAHSTHQPKWHNWHTYT